MVVPIKGRLKGKVKKFFANPKRVARLRSALAQKEQSSQEQRVFGEVTYKANIGGQKRFVKINSAQQVQRENIKRLVSVHNKAIKSRLISPRRYLLVDSNVHAYADHRVGIMNNAGGVSFDELMGAVASRQFGVYRQSIFDEANFIAKKYPKLTLEFMIALKDELTSNLRTIFDSRKQKDIAFDIKGNNIRVIGVDESGRLIIRLIDQVPTNGVKEYDVDMHGTVNDLALRYGLKKRKKEYIE